MGAIADKIRGRLKRIRGRLTDDPVLVAEGTIEQAKGDASGAASRLARTLTRTVKRVKTKLVRADRGTRVR